MAEPLEINNKTLLPIKDAVAHVSYSKDYITRLAREGKIVSRWVGRQWFVDVESLKSYAHDAQVEQQLRQRRLSEDRKRERELRAVHQNHIEEQTASYEQTPWRAVAVVGVAALGGLFVMSSLLAGVSIFGVSPGAQTAAVSKTQADYVPVAGLPNISVLPQFAIAATTTRATSTGLVLLPNQPATSVRELASLFSDSVETRTRAEGGHELVFVDESGMEEVLPVVVLPVAQGVVTTASTP